MPPRPSRRSSSPVVGLGWPPASSTSANDRPRWPVGSASYARVHAVVTRIGSGRGSPGARGPAAAWPRIGVESGRGVLGQQPQRPGAGQPLRGPDENGGGRCGASRRRSRAQQPWPRLPGNNANTRRRTRNGPAAGLPVALTSDSQDVLDRRKFRWEAVRSALAGLMAVPLAWASDRSVLPVRDYRGYRAADASDRTAAQLRPRTGGLRRVAPPQADRRRSADNVTPCLCSGVRRSSSSAKTSRGP